MAIGEVRHGPGKTMAIAPNRIRELRLAAGYRTELEFSIELGLEPSPVTQLEDGRRFPNERELGKLVATLGVPVEELYPKNHRQALGLEPQPENTVDAGYFYERLRGPQKLLISPDELTWSERIPRPDHPIEVYLSMSCGTQSNPHLLLDTVAVCEALGVNFAAAAGPAGCCGAHSWSRGAGEQWAKAKVKAQVGLGAAVNVNWCTNCQIRLTGAADKRAREEGVPHPVREVQILTFLEERIRAMGDRVPWKKEVDRRVAAEGHQMWSPVHENAQLAGSRLLSLIPGVQMVGLYDGYSDEAPCSHRNRMQPGIGPQAKQPRTAAEVRERREFLADTLNAMGADTVSCQHQGCHLLWSYYASDRLAVKHYVSVLAEALGVDHPDRFQAAARLGDPEAVLEQTRPIWQAWQLTEARARHLAFELADPRFAEGVTQHACGGGNCGEQLVSIDVLTAEVRPLQS